MFMINLLHFFKINTISTELYESEEAKKVIFKVLQTILMLASNLTNLRLKLLSE